MSMGGVESMWAGRAMPRDYPGQHPVSRTVSCCGGFEPRSVRWVRPFFQTCTQCRPQRAGSKSRDGKASWAAPTSRAPVPANDKEDCRGGHVAYRYRAAVPGFLRRHDRWRSSLCVSVGRCRAPRSLRMVGFVGDRLGGDDGGVVFGSDFCGLGLAAGAAGGRHRGAASVGWTCRPRSKETGGSRGPSRCRGAPGEFAYRRPDLGISTLPKERHL